MSWIVGWNVVVAWMCCGIGRSEGFVFGPRTENWGGGIDRLFRAGEEVNLHVNVFFAVNRVSLSYAAVYTSISGNILG